MRFSFPPLDGEGGATATGGVVPPPLSVQIYPGTSTLAATFPHPALRATLPTKGEGKGNCSRHSPGAVPAADTIAAEIGRQDQRGRRRLDAQFFEAERAGAHHIVAAQQLDLIARQRGVGQ